MISYGISHGAVTVVNAIPCGIGATVGIDITTKAGFSVSGSESTVSVVNDPAEDTKMAKICVRNTFLHFGTEEPEGWSLAVDSRIPVSKGLKSSSSACNAIVMAVSEWISSEYGKRTFGYTKNDVLKMIELGVKCAREANVTVTGAFDDACGCHLGGFVITDNTNNRLIRRIEVEENDVILLIPEAKIRKPSLNREAFFAVSEESKKLAKAAENNWYDSLTENGKLIAKVMNIDDSIAYKAIELGALAAGVSGTGPSVSVIVKKGDGGSFLKDLCPEGYASVVTRTR